jgi:short-subunit dehydrogenase
MVTGKGTALVTGASSGIGAIYADRLARRSHDLILVARDQGRLDTLAKRLVGETGQAVEVIAADLTRRTDLARVEQRLRTDASITVLVNNAGLGATRPLLTSDPDEMEQLVLLNVIALMRLAYAAAPSFVRRRGGAIINIASIAGPAPEILNGVFGGSKAFVLAFSLSLHKELSPSNVRVQVVLPGAVATEFWRKAGVPVEHLPEAVVMDPGAMVDAAFSGFDPGELVTIPSLPNLACWESFESAAGPLALPFRQQPGVALRSSLNGSRCDQIGKEAEAGTSSRQSCAARMHNTHFPAF